MPAARQDAQVLLSALTFRSLLDAIARPGKLTQLASPQALRDAPSSLLNVAALGALLTLLDRETSFAIAVHGSWLTQDDPVVRWIALRSGSNPATPEQAAFALLCDPQSIELLTQLQCGTLLEPENSATAFCCLERLGAVEEEHEGLLTLELRGPGIASVRTLTTQGLSRAQSAALCATRQSYPLGIDVYLVDAAGRCAGLPRTTRIQLVDAAERSA